MRTAGANGLRVGLWQLVTLGHHSANGDAQFQLHSAPKSGPLSTIPQNNPCRTWLQPHRYEPLPSPAREHSSEGRWQGLIHSRRSADHHASPSVGRNHFPRKAGPSAAQSSEERRKPAVAADVAAADVHSGRHHVRSVMSPNRRCRFLTSFGAALMAARSLVAVNATKVAA